jgi:catechol 2,3-dioxygenase-like lactoylglutathione lyase family enzyme
MQQVRSILEAAALTLAFWASAAAQSVDPNPFQLAPDHATASVADLDKECAWYERVLGFQELSRGGQADFQVRHLGIPGYRIDLVWQKGSSRPQGDTGALRQGWFHVVFKTDAIDVAFSRLMTLGTDVTANRTLQGAITRLIVHDAEGNELEIVPNPAIPPS